MISGIQSVGCHYVPNAFLMSVILFAGTFLISFHLKNFKSASFFPAKVGRVLAFNIYKRYLAPTQRLGYMRED